MLDGGPSANVQPYLTDDFDHCVPVNPIDFGQVHTRDAIQVGLKVETRCIVLLCSLPRVLLRRLAITAVLEGGQMDLDAPITFSYLLMVDIVQLYRLG